MQAKGRITTWKDDQGYGFIQPAAGGDELFVHIKSIRNRERRPKVGDSVSYTIGRDRKGRLRAENASLSAGKGWQLPSLRNLAPEAVVGILFLAVVAASIVWAELSSRVLIVYATMSLITFLAYALDKSAARRGGWRTSEKTLHMLALFGGWPGALLAQEKLRHKSRKTSFRVVFWATVVINCAGLAWLYTDDGLAQLERLLGAVRH